MSPARPTMPEEQPLPGGLETYRATSLRGLSAQLAGRFGTFVLAAAAALAPVLNAAYDDSFNPARLGVVLIFLLGLHLLRYRKVLFTREFVIYAAFLGYMTLSALWTSDPDFGMNTLVPGVNFLILLMIFGSLVAFHSLRAVVPGILFGFLCGAAIYTHFVGFPFVRPPDFSYNAIAGLYLFGLFSILVWGWYTGQRLACLLMATVALLLIAATTSIKTNLGVAIGLLVGAILYLKDFARVLGRSIVVLVAIGAAFGYAIISNDALLERLQQGFERVSVGVTILSERQDTSKSTSFAERQDWQHIGLTGWASNPVFGYGVEAFRADVGITSHSTPIDLLYNFGLIGIILFYAVPGALVQRLYRAQRTSRERLGALPIVLIAGVACYMFMSLAEPLHYNSFFAIFIAVSSALLRSQSNPS